MSELMKIFTETSKQLNAEVLLHPDPPWKARRELAVLMFRGWGWGDLGGRRRAALSS